MRLFTSLSVLTAIFPGEPGYPVLLKMRTMEVAVTTAAISLCKAPVRSSQLTTTNQHPLFYRPDALPVAQPTALEH